MLYSSTNCIFEKNMVPEIWFQNALDQSGFSNQPCLQNKMMKCIIVQTQENEELIENFGWTWLIQIQES